MNLHAADEQASWSSATIPRWGPGSHYVATNAKAENQGTDKDQIQGKTHRIGFQDKMLPHHASDPCYREPASTQGWHRYFHGSQISIGLDYLGTLHVGPSPTHNRDII